MFAFGESILGSGCSPEILTQKVQQASWWCYLLVRRPHSEQLCFVLFPPITVKRVIYSLANLWRRWLNRSSCNGEDTSPPLVATPENVAHAIKEVTHFYWFFLFLCLFSESVLIKFFLDSFTHVYNVLRLPSPPAVSYLPSSPTTLSLCRSLSPSHSCPFALWLTWFKQSHLCDHGCGTIH